MSKYREQFNKEKLNEDSDRWTIDYIQWLESKLKEAEEIHIRDMIVINKLKPLKLSSRGNVLVDQSDKDDKENELKKQ